MSTPQWWYAVDGQQQGPVSSAELKQLADSGQLKPTDLVWQEGQADWAPASNVRGLFPPQPQQGPPPSAPPPPAAGPPPIETTSETTTPSGDAQSFVTEDRPRRGPSVAPMDYLKQTLKLGGMLVGGGALVVLIAAVLPWYSWPGIDGTARQRSFQLFAGGSFNGFATWHGTMSFLTAIGVAIAVTIEHTQSSLKDFAARFHIGYAIAGGLIALFTVIFLLQASNTSAVLHGHSSIGVFIALIGGGVVCTGGVVLMQSKQRQM